MNGKKEIEKISGSTNENEFTKKIKEFMFYEKFATIIFKIFPQMFSLLKTHKTLPLQYL